VSEFWSLAEGEFGRVHAHSLARDLVLPGLADRSPQVALEAGVEPATVWRALCDAMDVPDGRRRAAPPRGTRRSTGDGA
jgi:hypothetical protein